MLKVKTDVELDSVSMEIDWFYGVSVFYFTVPQPGYINLQKEQNF